MKNMKNRERFLNVLNFKKVDDRLPMIEWVEWWDLTVKRWESEGLPANMEPDEISKYFGLDMHSQFWLAPYKDNFPKWDFYGSGIISDMESYIKIKEYLYPEELIDKTKEKLIELKHMHESGDLVIWLTLEGFFWFPRMLLGIENHFYAFYDNPSLIHKINQDLANYNTRLVEEFCKIIKPDFMTFAEDLSYNNGPMLSYEQFKEFLLPYYNQNMSVIKKHNIVSLVDTDGKVEGAIPWFIEAGIEGILPLERQAGVDVAWIRENYPDFRMIGGYDKMVMSKGEKEMRKEFERLLPVMKSGGFIPSCDHQTPPGVSLDNYRIYLKLLKEYCEMAVK